jgi:hypothetical protein
MRCSWPAGSGSRRIVPAAATRDNRIDAVVFDQWVENLSDRSAKAITGLPNAARANGGEQKSSDDKRNRQGGEAKSITAFVENTGGSTKNRLLNISRSCGLHVPRSQAGTGPSHRVVQ